MNLARSIASEARVTAILMATDRKDGPTMTASTHAERAPGSGPRWSDIWCHMASTLPDPSVASSWAVQPSTGAVVTFTGTVRDHAPGYVDVRGITYEAYEQEALRRMFQIAEAARSRWTDLGRVAVWHRVGYVNLGEASVQVTVAAAHRRQAFHAAQFCIDVLKESVPVWKLEHDPDRSGWAATGSPARSVAAAASAWTPYDQESSVI